MAQENNKMSWLEEVKADAEYMYRKRLREAEEDKKFEESKRVTNVAPVEEDTFEPEDTQKGKK